MTSDVTADAGSDGQYLSVPNPVAPKRAATLVLARDGHQGLEVLVIRRHGAIAFAPNAVVFPGGKVDPADQAAAATQDATADHQVADAAEKYAAVRELFEEAGILLALGADGSPVAPDGAAALADRHRADVENHPPRFAAMLERAGLRPALESLVYFAHWVTPEPLPRRFDTRFFLTRAPEGQAHVNDGREAVAADWVEPENLLKKNGEGTPFLMLPTKMVLTQLAKAKTVDDALAMARDATPVRVCPKVVVVDSEIFVDIPEAAGYGVTRVARQDMAEHLAGMLTGPE